MADWNQFEEFDGVREAERPAACEVCETMLPDAVDGILSEAEQRAFDRHVAGCVVCARELEEARRGAAWLGLLKQQAPEPSAALLDRILAQTTGALAMAPTAAGVLVPADVEAAAQRANQRAAERAAEAAAQNDAQAPAGHATGLPVWTNTAAAVPKLRSPRGASAWQAIRETVSLHSIQWLRPLLQPRMAMTAAMAFFSIALTLNLTGVRLSELSTSSLRPSAVRRTVADRSAAAVRSFQNMRVVYQAEVQVNDLRSNWQAKQDSDTAPAPQPRQEDGRPKGRSPENLQGSSKLDFVPATQQGSGTAKKGA